MQMHSVGIDLGKFTANMQMSLIGLEAYSDAPFLGRPLRKQGHDVRLIPAQFIKPFVRR